MSHEITINGNKAEMASLVGTKPWHGLGQELEVGASIDQWIVQAGMDWKVQRSGVRYAIDGNGGPLNKWDDNVVLFRSDNKLPLGLVSDGFKVLQPRGVMEFFRDLCENNGFQMRTAGTLFGGRKFWALADIGKESYVMNQGDKLKGRLLLVTACDGSMKTTAKFLAECVVCNNTLTAGLAEQGGTVVQVSHRSVFNPVDVKDQLGVSEVQWNQFIEQARALAAKRVDLMGAMNLTGELLAGPHELSEKEAEAVGATRGFKKIMALFDGGAVGANLKGRARTAWGWLNAVTQYADHEVTARSVDNRFNASQFGSGDKLKDEALKIAVYA